MDSDVKSVGGSDLSPRAGIAMLTLQVRATLQEASAAEAQYVPIDHTAARQQLLDRLAPLVEEREAGFAAELIAAEEEAAGIVADARRRAHAIVAERRAALVAARREAERLEAERLEAERLEAERLEAERLEAERLPSEEDPIADELPTEMVAHGSPMLRLEPPFDDLPSFEDDRPAEPITAARRDMTPVKPSAPAPIHVTIDADAFARVFATVFASLVDQRALQQPTAVYARPMLDVPFAPQPQAKQGFWSEARHPDVLLMGLATAIVLVVLAAWLV